MERSSAKVLTIWSADSQLSADFEDDASSRKGGRRVVGGQLLDWRRCLALFLWYASPGDENMKLPPQGMSAKNTDMFSDPRKLHLSLQGAIQYYLSKCWESRGMDKRARNHNQTVPHPWPAYVEDTASSALSTARPLHLLRKVVHGGPDKACARMSPAVREHLGWTPDKPRIPGSGALRAPTAAGDPAPAGRRGDVHQFWEGWAVDVRLELASFLFPTGLGADSSLSRLLETETNSQLGLDTELSWHLHEVLVRLAHLGKSGSKSAGKLAERLSSQMHASGHLLSLHQRSLLTQQFAAQLEMSGNWQAAAYVLISFAPEPSAKAHAASAMDEDLADDADVDVDARLEAIHGLRALLARHTSPPEASQHEPFINVANVCTLTVDIIAQRLQQDREVVLRWFLEAQTWVWASVSSASKRSQVRRLGAGPRLDRELDLCMRSGEWLRANKLLLELITPADLPDPSEEDPERKQDNDRRSMLLMHDLRRLHAGLSSFRRSPDWFVHLFLFSLCASPVRG